MSTFLVSLLPCRSAGSGLMIRHCQECCHFPQVVVLIQACLQHHHHRAGCCPDWAWDLGPRRSLPGSTTRIYAHPFGPAAEEGHCWRHHRPASRCDAPHSKVNHSEKKLSAEQLPSSVGGCLVVVVSSSASRISDATLAPRHRLRHCKSEDRAARNSLEGQLVSPPRI